MLVYRFRLSDGEIARAWLAEYYRRPGWRLWRVLGGPATVAAGVAMRGSSDGFVRWMGIGAMVLGLWYLFKPFLSAWMMASARRRARRAEIDLEVTIDENGVSVDDGNVRTELPWSEIRSAGMARTYAWFELGRGSRGTIPRRVIEDPAALRAAFEKHCPWSG